MNQLKTALLVWILFISVILSGCLDLFQNTSINGNILDDEKSSLSQCAEILGKGIYSTIQQALENASTGETIILYNGTYNETLDISKPLSLQAYPTHHPILQYIHGKDGTLLTLSASSCFLDGLILQCPPAFLDLYTVTGLKIKGSDTQVTNTTIQYFHYGIQISNEIHQNIFSYNFIKNNTEGAEIIYSTDNTFTFNNISNNTKYGLYFGYQSNDNMISDNIFYNNDEPVRLKTAYYNTVTRNTLIKNTLNITECCGAEGKNTITNNIIE